MIKPIPLIQASQLLPFTSYLDKIGAPTEKLLERCRLYPDLLNQPTQYIPEYQVSAFILVAGRAEGNPLDFGFAVGQTSRVEEYTSLRQYLASSLTLKMLLERFCRYVKLYSSQANFWVSLHQEGLWFGRSGVRDIDIGQDVVECYALKLMINLVRSVLGKTWWPAKLYLQMHPSLFVRTHLSLDDAEIVFNHPETVVVVDRWQVATPFSGWPEGHPPIAVDKTVLVPPPTDFVASLQEILKLYLHSSDLKINHLADVTGLSPRSLQRHLNQCGTTYAQVLDQVRFDAAYELMQDPHWQLQEIAEALGYNHQAHFTRAFKRWSGLSPRAFRQGLL